MDQCRTSMPPSSPNSASSSTDLRTKAPRHMDTRWLPPRGGVLDGGLGWPAVGRLRRHPRDLPFVGGAVCVAGGLDPLRGRVDLRFLTTHKRPHSILDITVQAPVQTGLVPHPIPAVWKACRSVGPRQQTLDRGDQIAPRPGGPVRCALRRLSATASRTMVGVIGQDRDMSGPTTPPNGFHPWGPTAMSAAVIGGLIVAVIWAAMSGTWPFAGQPTPTPTSVRLPSSGGRTTSVTTSRPTSSANRVQNLQLGISPGEISIAKREYTTIEVGDATPGAFVDVEIAQPAYVNGGVCRKLSKGKCNLAYSGGGEVDRDGLFAMKFPTQPEVELYSGLYEITIRDRHTGATVSISLAVN